METLIDFLKSNKPNDFTPKPHYSVAGDSLTFYFRDEESYRERIDDFLTVYKAISDGRLVGCQIKGLPKTLELLGDFGLTIQDSSVRLSMIFIACMAQTEIQRSKECYRMLAKEAGDAAIPREKLPLAAWLQS